MNFTLVHNFTLFLTLCTPSLSAHSVFCFLLPFSASLSRLRTPQMATTMCEPPPMTKCVLPPIPPCTTQTTAPPQEHQGELHLLAAAPAAQVPQPVEEPRGPLAPSLRLDAHKPATTPDRLPDCPILAMPSSTPSPVGARTSSPQLTPPLQPMTSLGTVASWTPLPNWPMTTMDTPHTTRPIEWVLHHLAWLLWRLAHRMRCTGWDLGWAVLGLGLAREVRLPLDQRLD